MSSASFAEQRSAGRVLGENVITILQEIQKKKGYLPRKELEEVAKKLGIPLSDVYGVATFYHQFKLEPPGMFTIALCMGTACYLRGNAENYELLRYMLNLKPGQKTTDDRVFTVEKARCFGCCSLAPVIKIGDKLYGRVTPTRLKALVMAYRKLAEKMRSESSRGEKK